MEIIAPVVARSEAAWYRDTYAQALLKLGRYDEARPVVDDLRGRGAAGVELLELARESGLLEAGDE